MSYKFFQNKECEYFPCHKTKEVNKFNCMFCYCPLYSFEKCGGNSKILSNGIKDCSDCTLPHFNYDIILKKLYEVNKMIDVYFAKIKDDAKIPSKEAENAGYDIYACFQGENIEILPHQTVIIPTGIKSAISEDYYFQIFERGSTGTKGMGQRCGVIDSGYRGEWFIPITNHNDDKTIVISKDININDDKKIVYPYSKAICQAVVLPVPKTCVKEISEEELMKMKSCRMENKLGSSGK